MDCQYLNMTGYKSVEVSVASLMVAGDLLFWQRAEDGNLDQPIKLDAMGLCMIMCYWLSRQLGCSACAR